MHLISKMRCICAEYIQRIEFCWRHVCGHKYIGDHLNRRNVHLAPAVNVQAHILLAACISICSRTKTQSYTCTQSNSRSASLACILCNCRRMRALRPAFLQSKRPLNFPMQPIQPFKCRYICRSKQSEHRIACTRRCSKQPMLTGDSGYGVPSTIGPQSGACVLNVCGQCGYQHD